MVELGYYSSVDWCDSAVSLDKAEALKSKSPKLSRFSYHVQLDIIVVIPIAVFIAMGSPIFDVLLLFSSEQFFQ